MVAINENKTPGTLFQAIRHFTPEVADAYIRSIKWPNGPCCVHCGSTNVRYMASRNRFQCRDCRKQSSVTTGTIMESSHIPLDKWMVAVWQIANCRMGVSSCELARTLGIKQTSAWHLLHRCRHLFTQENGGRMSGVVQCDETFVGGLVKYMTPERRERALSRENTHKGKLIVFGMLERSTGRVRAHVIPAASMNHVRDSIQSNIEDGSVLHTDNARIYDWADGQYTRLSVNHGIGQYVNGDVTTNGLECFFNTVRRMLKGCYIKHTPEHLSAYIDEQVWRFNVRHLSDWERFDAAMRLIVGKSLTYAELTDGAKR